MTRAEIESLIRPEPHPAWHDFCQVMLSYSYGQGPLIQAWTFYRKGWDAMHREHVRNESALLDLIRVAEAVRNDARAASQKYLDEKRAALILQQEDWRTLDSLKAIVLSAPWDIDFLKKVVELLNRVLAHSPIPGYRP